MLDCFVLSDLHLSHIVNSNNATSFHTLVQDPSYIEGGTHTPIVLGDGNIVLDPASAAAASQAANAAANAVKDAYQGNDGTSCRYVFDYSYNHGEATGTYHVYCNNSGGNDVALNSPGAEASGTMVQFQDAQAVQHAQAILLPLAISHDAGPGTGVGYDGESCAAPARTASARASPGHLVACGHACLYGALDATRRAVCAATAGNDTAAAAAAAPSDWPADFAAGACAAAAAASPVAGFVVARHLATPRGPAKAGSAAPALAGPAGLVDGCGEEEAPSPPPPEVDTRMLAPLDPEQMLCDSEEFFITL